MKKVEKIYSRHSAFLAYCYYLDNNASDYTETAKFLTTALGTKFTNVDVGKMFRHIIVFGNSDNMARDLVRAVNKRSRCEKNIYSKYLGYRYELPNLQRELERLEKVKFTIEQYAFFRENLKDFNFSEDDLSAEFVEKELNKYNCSFDEEQYLYIKERIALIEKNKQKSLIHG